MALYVGDTKYKVMVGNQKEDFEVLLPYDAEVEWLQTDGSAYIDTGVKPSSNTTFEIDAYIPEHGTLGFWVFGSRSGANAGQLAYLNDGARNEKSWRFGNKTSVSSPKLAEGWHHFDNTATPRILKIDNSITITADANTFAQTNYPIYLFCLNVNGTPSLNNMASGARMSASKFYQNGTLVFDGIAVRKNGVGYMYDKVSRTLFGNANSTGAFTYGNDVTSPIPYVEWLKSLGCVTWLPLTEGDLEDKITETTLTLSGNGSMTWDSSVGMYKFAVPSTQGQYVGRLSNGLSVSQFANDTFTTLCVFQKVTSDSGYYAEQPCLISTDTNTLSAICTVLYNGTSKASSIPSGTHHFAKTYKSDERKVFYDGAVTGTYAGYAAHLPSNWVTTENGIDLGRRYTNNVTYYMKDFYIFNTYLSLETIRQIQGYDPLPSNVIK